QQQMPLIFCEINGEDPDKVWESINLKLHSTFGYSEKLNTLDKNEKKYCLQLILLLQNWAFANKYPIISDGQQKNYPLKINFDNLSNCTRDLFFELLDIVDGKTESGFRNLAINAYNLLGKGARKPTTVIGRFLNFILGYYGSKGIFIIQSTLNSLIELKKLTYEITQPQNSEEYLNKVLVSETG
ncbi:43720_t:CDS:2, partial [Gigaspora margarita]